MSHTFDLSVSRVRLSMHHLQTDSGILLNNNNNNNNRATSSTFAQAAEAAAFPKVILFFNVATQRELKFDTSEKAERQLIQRATSPRTQQQQPQADVTWTWAKSEHCVYRTTYRVEDVFSKRGVFVELHQIVGMSSEVVAVKEIDLWTIATGPHQFDLTLNSVVHQTTSIPFRATVSFDLSLFEVCRSTSLQLVNIDVSSMLLEEWRRAVGTREEMLLRARYLDPSLLQLCKGNLDHACIPTTILRLNEEILNATTHTKNDVDDPNNTPSQETFNASYRRHGKNTLDCVLSLPGTISVGVLNKGCLLLTLETTVAMAEPTGEDVVSPVARASVSPSASPSASASPSPTPSRLMRSMSTLKRRGTLQRLLEVTGLDTSEENTNSRNITSRNGGGGGRHHLSQSNSSVAKNQQTQHRSITLAASILPIMFNYSPSDPRTRISEPMFVHRTTLQEFPDLACLLADSASVYNREPLGAIRQPLLQAELYIVNGPSLCQMEDGHFTDAGVVAGRFCAEFPRPLRHLSALDFRQDSNVYSCSVDAMRWVTHAGIMGPYLVTPSTLISSDMFERELQFRAASLQRTRTLLNHSPRQRKRQPRHGSTSPINRRREDGLTGTDFSEATSRGVEDMRRVGVASSAAPMICCRTDPGASLFVPNPVSSCPPDCDEQVLLLLGSPPSIVVTPTAPLARPAKFWEYWLHSIREKNDRLMRHQWASWSQTHRAWKQILLESQQQQPVPTVVEYFERITPISQRLETHETTFVHRMHIAICKANRVSALEPPIRNTRPVISVYRFVTTNGVGKRNSDKVLNRA